MNATLPVSQTKCLLLVFMVQRKTSLSIQLTVNRANNHTHRHNRWWRILDDNVHYNQHRVHDFTVQNSREEQNRILINVGKRKSNRGKSVIKSTLWSSLAGRLTVSIRMFCFTIRFILDHIILWQELAFIKLSWRTICRKYWILH